MLTGAKRHFVQFFSYNRDFKVFRGDRSRSAAIKDLLERVIAYARDVAPSFQRGMCKLFRHAHFEQMTHGIYLDSRIPGSANPPPDTPLLLHSCMFDCCPSQYEEKCSPRRGSSCIIHEILEHFASPRIFVILDF